MAHHNAGWRVADGGALGGAFQDHAPPDKLVFLYVFKH